MYYSEIMRINGMLQVAQEKGELQERLRAIQTLMESMSLSAEQAMDALKIPESEMPRYLDLLSEHD
jgi:hypothetical protein